MNISLPAQASVTMEHGALPTTAAGIHMTTTAAPELAGNDSPDFVPGTQFDEEDEEDEEGQGVVEGHAMAPVRMTSAQQCMPEVLNRQMCVHRTSTVLLDFMRDSMKKFECVIDAARNVTFIDWDQGTYTLPQPFGISLDKDVIYDLTPANQTDLVIPASGSLSRVNTVFMLVEALDYCLQRFGRGRDDIDCSVNEEDMECPVDAVAVAVPIICTGCKGRSNRVQARNKAMGKVISISIRLIMKPFETSKGPGSKSGDGGYRWSYSIKMHAVFGSDLLNIRKNTFPGKENILPV
jgi:hypothetical protein